MRSSGEGRDRRGAGEGGLPPTPGLLGSGSPMPGLAWASGGVSTHFPHPAARLARLLDAGRGGAPSCFSLRAVFSSCLCLHRYSSRNREVPESGGLKDTVSVLKFLWGEEVNFLEEKKSTLALAGFPSFPGSTYVGVRQAEERAGVETQGEAWSSTPGRILHTHLPGDSEEQSESPGHRPRRRPGGVSGHQTGKVETPRMTILPGDGGLGPSLPTLAPELGARVPTV